MDWTGDKLIAQIAELESKLADSEAVRECELKNWRDQVLDLRTKLAAANEAREKAEQSLLASRSAQVLTVMHTKLEHAESENTALHEQNAKLQSGSQRQNKECNKCVSVRVVHKCLGPYTGCKCECHSDAARGENK